jgi:hypothetical protein
VELAVPPLDARAIERWHTSHHTATGRRP